MEKKISAFTKENLLLQTILKFQCLLSKLILILTAFGILLVMVMVLITYDNSYIQLNYHMFTSNIRTIATVPSLYIYIYIVNFKLELNFDTVYLFQICSA